MENVKSKLVDEATEKTLILTIEESRRRRKREDQTLSSNGDVEAEDVATECDSGYQTIDDECRKFAQIVSFTSHPATSS